MKVNSKIYSLSILSSKEMWASMYSGSEYRESTGVWHYDGQTWENIPMLSDQKLFSFIALSPDGTLWLVSNRNINYDNYSGKIIKYKNGTISQTIDFQDADVFSVFASSNNTLWIIEPNSILHFDGLNLLPLDLPFNPAGSDPLNPNRITAFSEQGNTLCLAADKQGIWCKHDKDWENYNRNLNCTAP
ncbi:MAG: hypothetical protein QM730_28935 [Anaerolineales bacterium]